jgi:hypothetical protein
VRYQDEGAAGEVTSHKLAQERMLLLLRHGVTCPGTTQGVFLALTILILNLCGLHHQ